MSKKFYLIIGGGLAALFLFSQRTFGKGRLPPSVMRWDKYIRKSAQDFQIPPALIAAVIEVESGGEERSIGAGNEIGLMQLMLPTARLMGYTGTAEGLFQPQLNIYYGAKYLRYQWDRYGGDIEKVLSAYNAGSATSVNQDYVSRAMQAYKRY